MKKSWFTGFIFTFIAPVVGLICVAALGISVAATYEKYRLGQATDQIIRMVGLARDMRVTSGDEPTRLVARFYERLTQISPSEVAQVQSATSAWQQESVVMNPWGDPLRVFFYPNHAAVRLETVLPSATCRRLLLFYARDVVGLGIRRVDVKEDSQASFWRIVYQDSKTGAPVNLTQDLIYISCGQDVQNIVSLTFSL